MTVIRSGLSVAEPLARFVEEQVLPGLDIEAGGWWAGVAGIFARFAPENRALLAKRDAIQAAIDAAPARSGDEAFLREIGYLVDAPAPFAIGTRNVDAEIATMAGPQLVVPALNARFVLNAANARWGSLYDALYGTDALPGAAKPGGYDPERGAQVIAYAKAFLDRAVELADRSWSEVTGITIENGRPRFALGEVTVALEADWHAEGDDPWVGFRGDAGKPTALIFRHNGLHIEVVIDRDHPIGRDDPAGIADVLLEAALTTIVDLEDSIAAVDAEDKVAA